MDRKCEDCLFGKQVIQPYNKKVTPENMIFKYVHIDL